MTSTTTAAPAPLSRETGSLTMGLVALTAGLFALGAYIDRDTSGGWAILWFIATFAVLLAINAAAQRSVLVFVQIPGGALIYTVAGLVIFAG